jgi:hypothetical protein
MQSFSIRNRFLSFHNSCIKISCLGRQNQEEKEEELKKRKDEIAKLEREKPDESGTQKTSTGPNENPQDPFGS